jgi:hypothetical protein
MFNKSKREILMKLLSLITVLALSLTTTAQNLDEYIGTYRGGNKNGTAVISKVLVKDATLFEPAVFKYIMSMDYDSSLVGGQPSLEDQELKIHAPSQTLFYSGDQECDDPGCYYFDYVDVNVGKTKRGQPMIELSYSVSTSDPEEGQTVLDGVERTKKFYKVK